MLKVNQLYKSYKPKGEIGISGCGNQLVEKGQMEPNNPDYALQNVSFTVDKHEILAILGENGSGKSTLLKILSGLLQTDSGEVILNKKRIEGPSSKLVAGYDQIKLIHQNFNLFPNKTLEENILYVMRFQTDDYQQKKLDELLVLFNLSEIADKLPKEVSGGEQQRTAIAAALSTKTELLLFDEPFSNLDQFNTFILQEQIRKLSKKWGIPIVFVTHRPEDALSMSKTVSVLKDGQIVQTGTPIVIYNNPKSAYVAGLTGNYNLLNNAAIKHKLGLLRNYSYGIRLQDISISDELSADFQVVVKNVNFYGGYYVYKVVLNNVFQLLLTHQSPDFQIGSNIFVKFNKERIFKFDN
ncbi:MAG: ABC transporter ATP-binding protein [Bacteroidota bacterium]|nr:ABC transporter ATP-binding protein [Bacteroidota bacterium]